jgi:tetratricopeptide (TPR) repeat protein
VDRKVADLDIVDKQEIVDALKAKLEQSPDDQALKSQIEKEMIQLRDFQLKQLQSLVAAAPTDLTLKYKLGQALFGAGDVDGAIAQFQQASRDPKVRRESHRMLGISFMKREMYDMAAEFFNHALEDSSGVTSEAKDVIYQLGLCYEAQNLLDKAEEAFKRILKVDIGFRDVDKRIEEIQKKRKAETSS